MEILECIKTRRSHRKFSDQIVEDKKIEKIIEAGRYAPLFIIVANKKGYGNAMADCSCALENMMLEANELELGSCWINQLRWLDENPRINEYLKTLGLLDDEIVCGSLSVGYVEKLNRTITKRTGNVVTFIK